MCGLWERGIAQGWQARDAPEPQQLSEFTLETTLGWVSGHKWWVKRISLGVCSSCCLSAYVSTWWLVSAVPSVGMYGSVHFCWSHGRIYMWIEVHGNTHVWMCVWVCVCLCVCVHRRSTETMSKTVSPAGVSPEHLAGTFQTLRKQAGWCKATAEGCTTVIKKQRTGGWGLGQHHHSIHLLLARSSSHYVCVVRWPHIQSQ